MYRTGYTGTYCNIIRESLEVNQSIKSCTDTELLYQKFQHLQHLNINYWPGGTIA